MSIQASAFAAATPAVVDAGEGGVGDATLLSGPTSDDSGPGDAAPAGGSGATGTSPDEPFGVSTSQTPSGLEIYYQAGPKRLYRVRNTPALIAAHSFANYEGAFDWVEVPSVTTVNGVIDKSGALTWWGQGVGALGSMRLDREHGVNLQPVWDLYESGGFDDARKAVCDLLTQHKISTNHVRDEASDRGVNVHAAFEQWANDQRITPQPVVFSEHERGYVQGLADFLKAISAGDPTDIEAEVTVASLENRFAGRYDLRLRLQKPVEVVTRTYPVRADQVEVLPPGRYLWDLKTSKGVYSSHYLQLEAYEGASIECGYEPTDYRGVIHVTADGKYELHVNQLKNTKQPWAYEDFLRARDLYHVMNEVKR